MSLTDQSVTGAAGELVSSLDAQNDPQRTPDYRTTLSPTVAPTMGRVARYLRGDHDLPYMPRGAQSEYQHIAIRSITNWLPLISDTFAKGLFVDGYRPAKTADNARPWDYWQANGLDARQAIAHRGALEYGRSYVRVLPAAGVPEIRPLQATRTIAFFEDDADDWPVLGLYFRGRNGDGERLFEVYDDAARWLLREPKDRTGTGEGLRLVSGVEHGLGVCPLIRFRDRIDGEARGIIAPLLPLQDRVNETVFSLMIALQYASFRQRWATGLAIPVDENQYLADGVTPNPMYQQPIEPFKAAVDRLWVTDSPEARFGDFAQTEVSGHINAYKSTVESLAAIAQTPPHVLLGDLVNLSAGALAAARDSTQRKTEEYETNFGESWEMTLRLAAAADGDAEAASDTSAQVRWRDTEARSLAQTVDALGKMAQMLMVPVEALWDRIPGVTDGDVAYWRELSSSADGMAQLAAALTSAQTPTPGIGAAAPAAPAPAIAGA